MRSTPAPRSGYTSHWPAGGGSCSTCRPVPRSRRAPRRTSPGWSSVDAASATERSAIARRSMADRVRARPWLRTLVAAALPVGFVTALLFIPYVLLLVQSFWRLRSGVVTHELTLENYQRLFGTGLYPSTILFSAGIALLV